ncbi:hypothetical protein GBAR_LOCUS9936 [Geodia barretti]|nr:hypothetical protein GBAR_LOCUS9936 [Geodia barretti]
MCKKPTTSATSPFTTTSTNTNLPQSTGSPSSSTLTTSARAGIGAGVIVVVLLSAFLLLGLALFLYAYRRPTSRMGQFIIKHRPKARSLNKSSSTSYDVSTEKATLEEELQ